MVFNQLDIHLLITAICVISSALICYTIGVWGCLLYTSDAADE